MVFLTALTVALLQEIDTKDGWNVSHSGDIAVANIGGMVTIAAGQVKILQSKRYVFRSGDDIIDAVWDDVKLSNRRTVTVKGALKQIRMMPPLGTIELEGTDGEAELEMEILENKDALAKPEIDKDGKLRMGGAGIVLRLKGKVPKAIGVELRAGRVDVTLKNLTGGDLDLTTSGDLTLTDLDMKEIDAITSSGKVVAKGLKASKSVELESTSGDVTAERLEAPNVEAKSTSGNVDVNAVTGARLEVVTTSGKVKLKGLKATAVKIDATSGDVELVDCTGDELKIDATSGDVLLKAVKYAKRKIDTTSGTVTEK